MSDEYCNMDWEDLPKNALKAAQILGYTKESWDEDEEVPYDKKPFEQCTFAEKHAALFLGMDPVDKLDDTEWDDLDGNVRDAFKILGYDEQKWNDDVDLDDLSCDDLDWKEMTELQREAARLFGWSPALWAGDYDNDVF